MAKRPVQTIDFGPYGAAIKSARKARKESRNYVGDEMYLSPRYLANIENKEQHPSLQIFLELITRYCISVDQFLYKDTVEGKSTARRQLDSLLDGLDEKEISIVAATAQAIIDARTEGGERLRPTFLFLLEEKKKCADLRAKSLASLGCAPKRACGRRPGTKKKRIWSGFRDESCSFFVCALRPDSGFLGAVRTGFTACAAAAESY